MSGFSKGWVVLAACALGLVAPLSRAWHFGVNVALACSCNPPPPPMVARDAAALVFLGKVTDASPPNGDGRVTFAVERVYKGQVGSVVTAETRVGGTCGISDVTVGTRWLVYSRAVNPITMYACSRTKRVEVAGDDLAALGVGAAPVASVAPSTTVSSTGSPPSTRPRACSVGPDRSVRDSRAFFIAMGIALLCVVRRGTRQPTAAGPASSAGDVVSGTRAC